MKRIRNELIIKKFSYLKEIIESKNDPNTNIFFEEIDEELLKISLQNRYCDGAGGSDKSIYEVFFFNNGELYKNVIRIGEYSKSNYAYSQKINIQGETFADALYNFNKVEPIKEDFKIIIVNEGYYDWVGSNYSTWCNISIYKNNGNVINLINDIVNKIKKEIEEELSKSKM